jgi:nitroreductase
MEQKSAKIKTAQTSRPLHPLITHRWSARAFSNQPISEEILENLLEAASWAPSSMNAQPWGYQYALAGEEGFLKMWDCLMVGNQLWAKKGAALILSTAKVNFDNGSSNRHAYHDTGAATQNLLLEALHEGIYGHIMGGFHYDKTVELFGLEKGVEPICFIVLGYLDDPDTLEEPFKTRELTPRSRKPLAEFAQKWKG